MFTLFYFSFAILQYMRKRFYFVPMKNINVKSSFVSAYFRMLHISNFLSFCICNFSSQVSRKTLIGAQYYTHIANTFNLYYSYKVLILTTSNVLEIQVKYFGLLESASLNKSRSGSTFLFYLESLVNWKLDKFFQYILQIAIDFASKTSKTRLRGVLQPNLLLNFP